MKRIALVVALVVAVTGLSACTEKDQDKEKLLKWVDNTASLSARYLYREDADGREVVVRGLVEDDFKFKARLTVDGSDVMDQVVSDDALAVRFLDPTAIDRFVKSDPKEFQTSILGLQTRRWVLDAAGAPPLGAEAVDDRIIGVDPVVDSLSVLEYVKLAIGQAQEVNLFNPESINYRPAEDPFPKPVEGSGVDRWDLAPRPLPRGDDRDTTGQTNAQLAKVNSFRKMSVYVRDERVIQVREQIGVSGRLLTNFEGYMRRLLKRAPPEVEEEFTQGIEQIKDDPSDLAQALLIGLNVALGLSGEEPIRTRSMVFELRDLGDDVRVDVPTEVVRSKLDFFGVNALKRDRSATATGNTTTTTTLAPSTPAPSAPAPGG